MRGVHQAHLLADRHPTGSACSAEHTGPAVTLGVRVCCGGLGSGGGQVQGLQGLLGLLLAAR